MMDCPDSKAAAQYLLLGTLPLKIAYGTSLPTLRRVGTTYGIAEMRNLIENPER
jgi:hypothetical protein